MHFHFKLCHTPQYTRLPKTRHQVKAIPDAQFIAKIITARYCSRFSSISFVRDTGRFVPWSYRNPAYSAYLGLGLGLGLDL